MRIKGASAKSIVPELEVILKRPGKQKDMKLTVLGLPPDYDEQAENELPSPQPRRKGFATDPKGRILHDQNGRPIPNYDEDDLAYKKKVRRTSKLQTIKMIVDAIKPGQLEFDTKPGTGPEYYGSILDEMKSYGITIGDLRVLIEAIAEVSNTSSEDMDEATEAFLAEAT